MWEARVKHLWRRYYVEGCERFLGKSIFYVTFRHSTFWSEQDRKYILCNFFIGKLRHCERATKFEKNLPLKIWCYSVTSNFKRKIFSNFVAFSNYPNFDSQTCKWANFPSVFTSLRSKLSSSWSSLAASGLASALAFWASRALCRSATSCCRRRSTTKASMYSSTAMPPSLSLSNLASALALSVCALLMAICSSTILVSRSGPPVSLGSLVRPLF